MLLPPRVWPSRGRPHPILSEDLTCKQAATLGVFQSIDELLVEPKGRVGLGQVASKTNGSPSKAMGLKRKLIHGMPANSNLAKGSQKKTQKKVRVVSCIVSCDSVFNLRTYRRRIRDVCVLRNQIIDIYANALTIGLLTLSFRERFN